MCCCNLALPTVLKRIRRCSVVLKGSSENLNFMQMSSDTMRATTRREPVALVLIVKEMGAQSCLLLRALSRCRYRTAQPIFSLWRHCIKAVSRAHSVGAEYVNYMHIHSQPNERPETDCCYLVSNNEKKLLSKWVTEITTFNSGSNLTEYCVPNLFLAILKPGVLDLSWFKLAAADMTSPVHTKLFLYMPNCCPYAEEYRRYSVKALGLARVLDLPVRQ